MNGGLSRHCHQGVFIKYQISSPLWSLSLWLFDFIDRILWSNFTTSLPTSWKHPQINSPSYISERFFFFVEVQGTPGSPFVLDLNKTHQSPFWIFVVQKRFNCLRVCHTSCVKDWVPKSLYSHEYIVDLSNNYVCEEWGMRGFSKTKSCRPYLTLGNAKTIRRCTTATIRTLVWNSPLRDLVPSCLKETFLGQHQTYKQRSKTLR